MKHDAPSYIKVTYYSKCLGTEIQKPLSKQISKQVVVRRNTGRSQRGRQEYFCEICKIFVQDSYRYRHHYDIRFLRRYHLNYQ